MTSRRDALGSLATAALGAALPRGARERATHAGDPVRDAPAPPLAHAQLPERLPARDAFALPAGETYLSAAYTHPMPVAAARAAQQWIERRTTGAPAGANAARTAAREAFARLINAKPSEVGCVPNTSTAENLVVEMLGFPRRDANIVSDLLHFDGALVHLLELKARGTDVRLARPVNGRIPIEALARLIDTRTRLVEISLVSWYNGFVHDVKAVCDLAHAHGAYVYCDLIQGAGAIPFDVRATGVDFAACSTYKWLMGSFGLGFMYIREGLQDTVVRRPHWSYESTSEMDAHLAPGDPKRATPITYTAGRGAAAMVELGTMDSATAAALGASLPWIERLGVANIAAHRQPLIDRLLRELPRLGYPLETPADTRGPIVTVAHDREAELAKRLANARVTVRLADHWMRIAPSVYNDMGDIERLLEALA